MELFMSVPYTNIAGNSVCKVQQSQTELYQWYLDAFYRIFESYSCSKEEECDDINTSNDMADREEFISISLKKLIKEFSSYGKKPSTLFDCYSSAPVGGPAHTYKLAKVNNLPHITPIALNGQAGTEFVQGIEFAGNLDDKIGDGAIIAASQMMVWPDLKQNTSGYNFGDASASVIISRDYQPGFSKFKILKADILQFGSDVDYVCIGKQIEMALENIHLGNSDIKWSIIHNFSNEHNKGLASIFTASKVLKRDSFPTTNFGCADPLITLNECLQTGPDVFKDCGVVWFIGRYNSFGYMILSNME
jgi:hypothetical protein